MRLTKSVSHLKTNVVAVRQQMKVPSRSPSLAAVDQNRSGRLTRCVFCHYGLCI